MNVILTPDTTSNNKFDISSNQKSLWFLYQLSPHSCAYNMYYSTLLGGHAQDEIDLPLLEKSYYQTIAHHQALRTGYGQDKQGVYGFLAPAEKAHFAIEKHQLTEQEKDDWVASCADQPFVLEQGYVCRVKVLLNEFGGKTTPYLVVTTHHIAGDFYSMEKMVTTWAQYYAQLVLGTPAPLPSVQYQQWVNEQQLYLGSEAAKKRWHFGKRN